MKNKKIGLKILVSCSGALYGFFSSWVIVIGTAMAFNIFSDEHPEDDEYAFLVPYGIMLLVIYTAVSIAISYALKNRQNRLIFWITALITGFLFFAIKTRLSFGSCAVTHKDSFSITEDEAYQLVLEEGQKYIDNDFVEWQNPDLHSEKPTIVDLKLLLDSEYEEKVKIWVVRLKCDKKILTFVVDDQLSETIGGWCSDETEDHDFDKLKVSDEAIIRAILYYNIWERIHDHKGDYDYKSIYVIEEISSFESSRMITDLSHNINIREDILPAGRKIMRIGFCNHTGQHNWFEFDTQITVDSETYDVYGFYRTWP